MQAEIGLIEPASLAVLSEHFIKALQASDEVNYEEYSLYMAGGLNIHLNHT